MTLPFRLLNVFAIDGAPFSGNQLAVFPDAGGLSTEAMQAWARQFNLSESTFVTAVDPETRSADVRIFTAGYEMPFAGHPTLGTAHVVAGVLRELGSDDKDGNAGSSSDAVTLSMPAGRIPVRREGSRWQLSARAPSHREPGLAASVVAETLGVAPSAVAPGGTAWVDTGVEQLMVRLADVDAVRACDPSVALMNAHLASGGPAPHAYAWAWTGESSIEARLFAVSGKALDEDPATGSACANLGGWLVGQGHRGIRVEVSQGAQVGRPSRLMLTLDEQGGIHVGGEVVEVGDGTCHS